MIKAKVIRDFYFTDTKEAYRKDKEYMFTNEQFAKLFSAGLVISEIEKDSKAKEIKIKKSKKIMKYNA